MLSCLIVIIRLKKKRIDWQQAKDTDWHEDIQNGHKNKEKNFKSQHSLLSVLVPQIEYLYYPLNVDGVTQKGSL